MWLPWEDTSPDTFANLGGYPDTLWEGTFANALRDQLNPDPSGSTSLSIMPTLHCRIINTTGLVFKSLSFGQSLIVPFHQKVACSTRYITSSLNDTL